ncbi:L-dopachrome tautomerase yellow-f2-like [Lutzomyia longipalpis]|uniref:L-dopachrome tautomerase yellow-f2-like n=1 Tax=Lutzomyia longipalpis TaxID=7200 RepID=UPI0024845056|nr:L-dopachrome tautomerase yellow-f2-like [Lutzomyia longipalpis]
MKYFIFIPFIFLLNSVHPKSHVEEVYKWKKVEFESLPQPEDSYVGPYKYYAPENSDVMGMGYHPASGLMIVILGRLRPGSPATIAAFCANEYKFGSSPKFWAFPNFEIQALRASDFDQRAGRSKKKHKETINYQHYVQYAPSKPIYPIPNWPTYETATKSPSTGSNFRIISAYQVEIDYKCNRAYFVDVGHLNYFLRGFINIQKPSILVYDLPEDGCKTRNFQLIRRVEMPDSVAARNPFGIVYITLDKQSSDCDDLYLYINNFDTYTIVYDYKRDDFWHFTGHPSFEPVVAESFYVYEDALYSQVVEGLMSYALGYADANGDRTAYYITGASTAQYEVSTKILKDKSKAPMNYEEDDFRIMGYRGCFSQAGKMAVDYTYGVVFYAERQSNRIRCWNMKKLLNPDNIGVVFDSFFVQYPFSLFIDPEGYLWFNNSRLPILAFTNMTLDLNTINNRFFRVKISDAIRGTVCEND